MYLITFKVIIILISNSAFCYLSHGNGDVSVMPKVVNFQGDSSEYEDTDKSLYESGVDESKLDISSSDSNIQNSQEINGMGNNILPFDNLSYDVEQLAVLNELKEDLRKEEDFTAKSAMLLQLLESSTMSSNLPIVYVEDQPTIESETLYKTGKRSGRYYRRYPWKRQNNKHRAINVRSIESIC